MLLHGWPGIRCRDLVTLSAAIARHGRPDTFDFSYADARPTPGHPPHDGASCSAASERFAPGHPSRCGGFAMPIGRRRYSSRHSACQVRLIDRVEVDENPHLDLVLLEAVRGGRAVSGPQVTLCSCTASAPTVARPRLPRSTVPAGRASASSRRSATFRPRCRGAIRMPHFVPRLHGWHQSVPPRDPINE